MGILIFLEPSITVLFQIVPFQAFKWEALVAK